MKREEQIKQEALKFAPTTPDEEKNISRYIGCIYGANWADEHPRKGLVDIERVKDFLSSVELNFYREWEDKFNTDELIVDLEKYLEEQK